MTSAAHEIPTLHTPRLTLRPLTLADAAALFPMFADPEAMRFMPTPPHETAGHTRAYLASGIGVTGARYWAICLQGDDEPLGIVNYLGQTRVPGMGYILRRDHWNRGLTTEACRAALDYGFGELGLDRVELWIDERNLASQRVAIKLGFTLKGQLPLKYGHKADHHIMLVWGCTAAAWNEPAADLPQQAPRVFGVEPVLVVRDVAAAAAFYRDRLGFHVDFLYGAPPTHGGVSCGDWSGRLAVLQLSQAPAEEEETRPAGYLYFKVDAHIDELYAGFAANGVTIISSPKNYPWGMREFAVRDLDGHELRFGTQR